MLSNADVQERRGRRHLDGKAPGSGKYVVIKSVSLLPADIEELEEIGNGNRSQGVRTLLDMYRQIKNPA